MNQILNNKNPNLLNENLMISTNYQSGHVIKSKIIYKTIFAISVLLLITLLFFLIISQIHSFQRENFSRKLISNYSVLSLYGENFTTSQIITNETNNDPDICGIIEIPSINIKYPIFSTISEELLKNSVCKFYGEMPPKSGNLCVAGHNYENGKLFSSIPKLKKEDQIYIYDLNYHKYTYSVFDIYEVKTDDLSPLNYSSNSYELTLVTCNNWNKNRIIIKACIL